MTRDNRQICMTSRTAPTPLCKPGGLRWRFPQAAVEPMVRLSAQSRNLPMLLWGEGMDGGVSRLSVAYLACVPALCVVGCRCWFVVKKKKEASCCLLSHDLLSLLDLCLCRGASFLSPDTHHVQCIEETKDCCLGLTIRW